MINTKLFSPTKLIAIVSAAVFTLALLTTTVLAATPSIKIILSLSTNNAGVPTGVVGRFTDPDLGDVHTAVWNWGDGNTSVGTVTEPVGLYGSVIDTHTYAAPGTYNLTLSLTDSTGTTVTKSRQMVINP